AVIKANGYDASRVELFHGLSTEIELPEKVDVVVSETLDHLGVGENTIHFMQDARERMLKPGGVFLPGHLKCWVSLASPKEYARESAFWNEELLKGYHLDYRRIGEILKNKKHVVTLHQEELFSPWQSWQETSFNDPEISTRSSMVTLNVKKDGEITGVGHAFEVRLCDGVMISTLPDQPPTHWQQGFVPFPKPLHVKCGDRVQLEYTMDQGADVLSLSLKRKMIHFPID
ncbi:MAG: hypothetical protein ABIK28_11300, partial [Planctomycetota bacterium]